MMAAFAEQGMAIEPAEPRWYAVMTEARQERRTTKRLRERGYRVFYPWVAIDSSRPGTRNPFRLAQLRKLKERGEEPQRALFARYIFVGLVEDQGFFGVKETAGVSTIVYAGVEPLEIPSAIMAEVMRRCDEDGRFIPPRPVLRKNPWEEGDRVTVDEGPFRGFSAVVIGVDDPEKARILVDIFGRMVPIVLDANKLAKAAPSRTGRVKHPFTRTR